MSQIKILLCCGAGMSSGFLANNARKAARKANLNMSIEARSTSEVNEFLSSIDVLMIGPHYANELHSYQDLAKPYGLPVVVIPNDVYSQLDGQKLIEVALKEINK